MPALKKCPPPPGIRPPPPLVPRTRLGPCAFCAAETCCSADVLWKLKGVDRSIIVGRGYYFLLAIASFLGLVWSPVFFSCHLLVVVNKSEILRSVSQSVTLNGRALLLTALLGCHFPSCGPLPCSGKTPVWGMA